MKFGLTDIEYLYFVDNLVTPFKKAGACLWVFGSRSSKNHHKYSDIDVLVAPKNSTTESLAKMISEKFETGNFPIKLDLVFDKDLADSYRKSVEQQKVVL